jgi:ABC-2 type transport system permease protein
MINTYRRFWQVNWAEQWQYRANLLMYLLYWLVSPIVYLAVWTTIARTNGSINGLTANYFTTYYLTLLVVDVITSEVVIHMLAYKVQDGTLANELLRPVHPILTGTLINNLAFKTLTLMGLVPVWLVLYVLFRPDYSAVTWGSALLTIPALILGFAISFLLGAAVTCVAFWTTRVYSVSEFYYAITILFSGQFVPLDLMPPFIRAVAQFLPFQLARYFPVQLFLNQLPPQTVAFDFGMGIFWLIVSYLIFRRVWAAGVKRFSAVGA